MEAMISGGGEGKSAKVQEFPLPPPHHREPIFPLSFFLSSSAHSRALVCIYFRLGCAREEKDGWVAAPYPQRFPQPYTIYFIFPL